ncbi:MAG: TonB-dependent receptor [Sphingobium sp.]|nr:TonB-dependent receptor [Sphingobium sp.]
MSQALAQQSSPPTNPVPPAPATVTPTPTAPTPAAPATTAPTPATTAAPADAAVQNNGLGDIIVTARRQSERLQSTPVAVTALGSESLQQTQVQDAVDLQRVTPSLSIQTGGPSVSGLVFLSIRGQNNQNPGTANDPTVATYLDGVYIPRPSQGQTDFNDLERIEVLRGPQGTLFGRNTTGGALNVLTAQPTYRFELLAKAEAGNYDYKSIGGTVNVPLTDALAFRVTGAFRDRGGYAHNDALDRDTDDSRSYFARAKLRYEGAGFDITLSGDYNRLTDHGQKIALVAFDPAVFTALPGGAAVVPILNQYIQTKNSWYTTNGTSFVLPTVNAAGTAIFNTLPADVQQLYSEKPQNKVIAYGFAATANVELGNDFAIKSITAYRYSDSTGLIDTDGTPVPLLTTRSGYGSKQFSEELQLTGKVGDRFNFILGGYYGNEDGYESSVSQTFGFIPAPRFITENFSDVKNVTKGVFGQGYYKLLEGLRLAGGLRWTWDNRDVVLHNKMRLGDPSTCSVAMKDPGSICDQTQKATFNYPAWTLGIDYQASPTAFFYAKTSGAAKSGGWNVRAGSLPAFSPEKLKDVEAGAKLDWLDHRLRTNATFFYSWTKGVQRQLGALFNGQPTQYLINAGNTRIYGAEFEITAVPWKGMEVAGNLSLLRGHYQDGTFIETQIVNGLPVQVDRSGEPLPQLPRQQFTISATQRVPASFGTFNIHADYSYISSQMITPVTAAPSASAATKAMFATQNALTRVAGYGLLNGRIGLQLEDPAVEVYVFGRNLTGKKYTSRVFADLYTQGLGFIQRTVGDPFTFGAGVTYRFGGR